MVLISLSNLPGPLLSGAEEVPAVIIYVVIVHGIVGLIAAVGLWMLKKWSFWLTIVISVLDILSSTPGLVLAPNGTLLAAAGVIVPVFIIVMVVLPTSRRALTAP